MRKRSVRLISGEEGKMTVWIILSIAYLFVSIVVYFAIKNSVKIYKPPWWLPLAALCWLPIYIIGAIDSLAKNFYERKTR